MVAPGNNNEPGSGKKDRRDAAREKARLDREVEKRRARRNRGFLQGGIVVVVLAVAAIITLVVVNSSVPSSTIGPKNMASNGIILSGPDMTVVKTSAAKLNGVGAATKKNATAVPVSIVTYIDYQCPYCEQFETANNAQIATWVKGGQATVEIHPIAILDNASLGNKYSTRAANAAVCVANFDPNKFFAVNSAFFANQPAEQSGGKTDAELLATMKTAGASSDDITKCVKNETFAGWVKASTAQLKAGSKLKVFDGVATEPQVFEGTPTVFVNGQKYPGSITDPAVFASFVQSIATS